MIREVVPQTFSLASKLQDRDCLNLGCGHKHLPAAINLDLSPEVKPDILHDINRRPWPLPDNQFREVLAYDVIEHLDDFFGALEEIHRVCQDKAVVQITVPHFSSANTFTDPTHRRAFGFFSFDYVTGDSEIDFYTRIRFRARSRRLIFSPTLLNKLVWRLANRYPAVYEQRWTWIFPAWYLHFELEVIKS